MSGTLVGGALLSSRGEVRVADLSWDGESLGGAGGAPLDATGCIVLPGLVCGHVRLSESLFPGMPERPREKPHDRAAGGARGACHSGFALERLARYRAALDLEAISAAVKLGALECLLAGCTVVFDLHAGPVEAGTIDAIAAAVESVGLRAALSLAVDETRGADEARLAIRENVRFHREALAGSRFRGAMGIADPDRLPATLVEASTEARKAEMPAHLVLAGSAASRRTLAVRGMLRPGSLAVMAPETAIDDEERALLRDLHVAGVVLPRATAAWGSPAPSLKGFMGRALLGGWDAAGSPLDERAALVQSIPSLDRQVAFEAMTRGGYDLAAETFELEYGRFGDGAPADLVVLEPAIPAPVTAGTVHDHLDRLGARNVRHVIVAGEVRVQDGRTVKVDAAAIRAEARKQLTRVWKKAAG